MPYLFLLLAAGFMWFVFDKLNEIAKRVADIDYRISQMEPTVNTLAERHLDSTLRVERTERIAEEMHALGRELAHVYLPQRSITDDIDCED